MKKLLLLLLLPFITYGQVQIGEDIDGEAINDSSGRSVSLSSNGSIVAVGATGNDANGTISGHVRVYANQNGSWVQIGQDIDGEAEGDLSGFSTSLSSDGNTIVVGAISNNTDSGYVRVYGNQNDSWVQIGQNINGEANDNNFGNSVSISSDAAVVAIGARRNNGGNGDLSGHIRVYANQNGSWVQIGQDIDGEAEFDISGFSISLSSDGNTVAIGAPGNDENGTSSGHIRVYVNQNGSWVQIGQDIDGEVEGDESGFSVSLSADGNIVAIGAPDNDGNGTNSGHVRVYANQNGSWVQMGQDIDGESVDDTSGVSVSLSADGSILAIGASDNDGNGNLSGHVRIYQNQNGNWVQIGQDIDGESTGDLSGDSISLSSNGNIVAIGAPINAGNGSSSGHVRVFDLSDLLSTEEFTPSTFSLYPNPASTQVTVEIPQENTLEKITIYNNLGQLVPSSKQTNIDTSALSQGVYIIEVTTNQGTSSKKLIVE